MSEIFSDNLTLRQNADKLFDQVDSLPKKKIVLDFNSVASMSRSFAHQYTLRKNKSRKEIIESKKTKDVTRMLELVKKSSKKEHLFNINKIKAIAI